MGGAPNGSTKRYLRQQDGWLFEDFGEEMLLFSLEDYRPRLLGGAAADVLRLTDGRAPAKDVAARLAETYGQDFDRVFKDVERFYRELEEAGIVREAR